MKRSVSITIGLALLGCAQVAVAQEGGDEAVILIPEVEVEAERDEPQEEAPSPRRSDVIDDEALDRRSSWRLGDALQWLTSATPVESTGTTSGLIVDGLPAAQLEVVEGGMPVSRPVGGPDGPSVDLDAIGLAGRDVERVEVHRGMGPPGSGPTGGVVVELHRRDIEPGLGLAVQTAARGGAGQMADAFPMLALGAGRLSYGAEPLDVQVRASADARRGVDVNDDGRLDSADQQAFEVGLRSRWRPSPDEQDRLVFDASFDDRRTEGPFGEASVLRDLVDTRRFVGRLSGEWFAEGGWRLEHVSQVDAYEHRFSKRVLDSGFERLKSDTDQLRVVQDVLGQTLVGDHLVGVELYGAVERIGRVGETGELPAVERLHGGLGLSDAWAPADSVEVSGRLWGDVHTDFAPGWMADIGVGWQASERVELRASASRTRRLPTAEELFLFFDHSEVGYKVTGNADLHPERLWSGRAGVQVAPPLGELRVDAELFYHRLDDLITTVQTDASSDPIPTFTYDNIARAQTGGLRLGLGARELPWGLDMQASYTWLPIAENLDTGERLDLRTRHQVLVELRRDWLDERLETWIDLRSRAQLEVPDGSPAAPAYALLGVGAGWRPADSFVMRLAIDNLLDQTNATWGPKTGPSVLASVEYRYQSQGDE